MEIKRTILLLGVIILGTAKGGKKDGQRWQRPKMVPISAKDGKIILGSAARKGKDFTTTTQSTPTKVLQKLRNV